MKARIAEELVEARLQLAEVNARLAARK
jgi:hypothetical protein